MHGISIRRTAIVAGLFVTLMPVAVQAQRQTSAQRAKVVVISLDAFGVASLHEPDLPAPTLHELMKKGVHAASMQPINPTVTWPNSCLV